MNSIDRESSKNATLRIEGGFIFLRRYIHLSAAGLAYSAEHLTAA